MNASATVIALIAIWVVLPTHGQEPIRPLRDGEKPPSYQFDLSESDDIATMVREIGPRWPEDVIDPRSRDYAFLEYLKRNRPLARKAMPELIEISGILEPKPITREKFSKLYRSPAGACLVGLRDDSEPVVKAWLASHKEGSQTREVLEQALETMAKVRKAKAEKEAYYAREREKFKAQRAESSPEGSPSLRSPDSPSAEPILAQTGSEETGNWWLLGVAAGVAVICLVVLAMRRRWNASS